MGFISTPRRRGRKKKRRIGGQPGHPKHERTAFEPREIDQAWDYYDEHCPDCHGKLKILDKPASIVQQIEIVKRPIRMSEHRSRECYCAHCRKSFTTQLPREIRKSGLVGPRLTTLIGYHKAACHNSFSTIRKYLRLNEHVLVQFCLAHLIRDVKFLVEHPVKQNRAYGERLLTALQRMFSIIHRRDQYATEHTFRAALLRAADDVLEQATTRVPQTREARALAQRFERHGFEYLQFVITPGVEPTNNLAEQAIRFVVIDRRITQGTRSIAGRRWCERIWTAIATCAQQGRSVFKFLTQSITAYLRQRRGPTLLPIDSS